MSKHYLIHLGIGNVGRELVRQIQARPQGLVYCGLFDSKGGIFDGSGLSSPDLNLQHHPAGGSAEQAIGRMPTPFTLIDTTASEATLGLIKLALERGGSVVMSNKKPVSGSQADFDALTATGRVFFETTVGAGLPVIGTLQSLLATGDEVEQIQGCFSGTLGYIFSELASGAKFSAAVREAKAKGFTEPNTRDDLSGTDVARKALILARLLGRKLELTDITLNGLFPDHLSSLPADKFMERLPELDGDYAKKVSQAKGEGKVLRYVATITQGACRVGLERLASASDIGALSGPDNIVVIQTKRYHDNPLIIKGPGAGVPVTAAGVFADVLRAQAALQKTGVSA